MHEYCVRQLRRYGASGRCPICRFASNDLMPVQKLLDCAMSHFLQQSYEKSLRMVSEVFDLDPQNHFVISLLAKLHAEGKGVKIDLDYAAELLEEASGRGNALITASLGMVYMNQGNLTRAKLLLEEARRMGERDCTILGELYMRQGDLSQAQPLFEEATREGNPRAWTNLGVLYMRQGMVPQAFQRLGMARRLGDPEATTYLGVLLLEQGDFFHAHQLLDEACRLGDPEARTIFASIYMKQGNFSQARSLLEEAFRLGNPDAADLLETIAAEEQQNSISRAQTLSEEGRRLAFGSFVHIRGLASLEGQKLNGSMGIIIKYDAQTGRFSIVVPSKGVKAIKPDNLILVGSGETEGQALGAAGSGGSMPLALDGAGKALSNSEGSEAQASLSGERDVNAQVGEALLRHRELQSSSVLLVTYSRKPNAFR